MPSLSCGDHSDRAVRLEDLPHTISNLPEGLLIRFVKQALGQIESRIEIDADDPLCGCFLWPISNVGKSDPEAILPEPSPKAPAVVLLDRLRKFDATLWRAREFLLQPRRKILSEATRIDEVRLHFAVLKEISLDRDSLH